MCSGIRGKSQFIVHFAGTNKQKRSIATRILINNAHQHLKRNIILIFFQSILTIFLFRSRSRLS